MSDLDEFKIMLQNQIDALNNGQFDFLLYNKGSGGEFLCSLIRKYSKKYGNISFKGSYNENGRFLERPPIFADALVGLMPPPIKLENEYTEINVNKIMGYLENKELFMSYSKYNKFKSDYLILDNYLNSGKRLLIRSHFIFKRYMNPENTYYMNCDSIYWEMYRYNLCRIKVPGFNNHHCKGSSINKSIVSLFSKNLYMSKFLEKGYLEEMFDIQDPNFHIELIQWHKKNKKLINNYLGK